MSIEYQIRTQSNRAYTYGLGEKVVENVYLFRFGNYDLNPEELEAKIRGARARKVEDKNEPR